MPINQFTQESRAHSVSTHLRGFQSPQCFRVLITIENHSPYVSICSTGTHSTWYYLLQTPVGSQIHSLHSAKDSTCYTTGIRKQSVSSLHLYTSLLRIRCSLISFLMWDYLTILYAYPSILPVSEPRLPAWTFVAVPMTPLFLVSPTTSPSVCMSSLSCRPFFFCWPLFASWL